MEIYLAHTQGFCAGVARAIDIVDKVLKEYGTPLFVYHEIVHNKSVVRDFEQKGVQFVDDLEEVPDGARLIFSAHGVSPVIVERAKKKKLHFIDATCPLVSRIHRRAQKLSDDGIEVILIGHKKHQEVVGTQGYVNPKYFHIVEKDQDVESLSIPHENKIGYVTQTTLSLDDTRSIVDRLKARFPNLIFQKHDDICYATQNRQDAVRDLCQLCDIVIVCGSPNSSNSNRLREAAAKHGVKSYLVDTAEGLNLDILRDCKKVGISSGASVPYYIVEEVIKKKIVGYKATS